MSNIRIDIEKNLKAAHSCKILRFRVVRTIIHFLLLLFSIQQANAAIIIGNPQGSVTLSFVYGYQCIHCHYMFPMIKKLIVENPDLCVKLYPVAALNKNSLIEATAAIAATRIPGKFQELTDLLMHQPPLQKPDIDALLHRIGLDSKDFLRSTHERWVSLQIFAGLKIMRQVHAAIVPVILIGKSDTALVEQTVLIDQQSYKILSEKLREVAGENNHAQGA